MPLCGAVVRLSSRINKLSPFAPNLSEAAELMFQEYNLGCLAYVGRR